MLTRLRVQNFKCLLNVDVKLNPFTILIGPNDSGKSSLLDAISLLGRTTKLPFSQLFVDDLDLSNLVWMRDTERIIQWDVEGKLAEHRFTYSLGLSPLKQTPVSELLTQDDEPVFRVVNRADFDELIEVAPTKHTSGGQYRLGNDRTCFLAISQQRIATSINLASIGKALLSSTKYQLDTGALRKSAPSSQNPELFATGSNIVAVLDSIMTNPDRSAINSLETALRTAIPTVQAVTLPVAAQNEKTLHFVLQDHSKTPKTIPSLLASDGAMLITAFLALAYGNTPDIVFVEEPENGLHYSLLGQVIDLLRKISTGAIGDRPRQVVVTTHSPLLLNFADPTEVLVCQRGNKGGTTVTPMTDVPNLQQLLQEFAPGELWYLLGEEKMAKGAA